MWAWNGPASACHSTACVPVQPPHRRLAPTHPPWRCVQGEAKRVMLASLTRSLGEVLPFLERMLELSFAAAGQAVAAGNREAAQQHVAVIQAALAAANTYSGGCGCMMQAAQSCDGAAGPCLWEPPAGVGCHAAALCQRRMRPTARIIHLPSRAWQSGCLWGA